MSEQNGRDASGRFLPGHAIKSPGRPRKAVEERYLCILSQRVTPEVFAKIVDKAAEQALEGDAKAREWLSWYLIGKPTEYVAADLTSNGDGLADLFQRAKDDLQRRLCAEPAIATEAGVPAQPER